MNLQPDHGPVDGGHNQDGEGASFKALLLFKVLVAGKKNVKAFLLDQLQERTVFDAAPLHADDGMNLMSREGTGQLVRYVLVKQNLQGCA